MHGISNSFEIPCFWLSSLLELCKIRPYVDFTADLGICIILQISGVFQNAVLFCQS